VRKIILFTFSFIFGNIIDLHQQYIFPAYTKKESREKCPNPAIVQITVTGGNEKFVDQTFRQIEDRIKEKHVKTVIFILGKFIFDYRYYNSVCDKCMQRQKNILS
jgi:precorrin-4 methylase